MRKPILIKKVVDKVRQWYNVVSPAESDLQMSIFACEEGTTHLIATSNHGHMIALIVQVSLWYSKVEQVQLVILVCSLNIVTD